MNPLLKGVAALGAVALIACRPEFDDDYWRVDSPRVLAVKSEPAEAKPGTRLTFTAFLSVIGTPDRLPVWNFCTAPKPLTENDAVSPACLASSALVSAGTGLAKERHIMRRRRLGPVLDQLLDAE